MAGNLLPPHPQMNSSDAFVALHSCLVFSVNTTSDVFYALIDKTVSTEIVLELLLKTAAQSLQLHSLEGPVCLQKSAPGLWHILTPQDHNLHELLGPITSAADLGRLCNATDRVLPNVEALVEVPVEVSVEEPERAFRTLHFTKREVSFLIGKKGDRLNAIRFATGCIIRVQPVGKAISTHLTPVRIKDMPQDLTFWGTPDQVYGAVTQTMVLINQFRANGPN